MIPYYGYDFQRHQSPADLQRIVLNRQSQPDTIILIIRVEEPGKHLSAMNIGWSHGKALAETINRLTTDTILISVVSDAILFHPADI